MKHTKNVNDMLSEMKIKRGLPYMNGIAYSARFIA